VSSVRIAGTSANGTYRDGSSFRLKVPASQEQMLEALRQKNVEIWYTESLASVRSPNWLVNLVPLALLAALWFFMVRQMRQRTLQSSTGGSNLVSGPGK
jgi:ATP-dependent Zn protease